MERTGPFESYSFRAELIDDTIALAKECRVESLITREALNILTSEELDYAYAWMCIAFRESLKADRKVLDVNPPPQDFDPHLSRFSRQHIWERSG